MRVAIVQPSLAKYRLPFYQRLAQREGLEIVVHYSLSRKIASVEPEGFQAAQHRARELTLAGAPIIWRPFQIALAKDPAYDAMVFSWNARDLLLARAMRAARRSGKAVLLWGHGYSKRESVLRRRLRLRLARLADVVILYDQRTRERLAASHPQLRDKLTVAPNAIDQTPVQEAKRPWLNDPDRLGRFQREHRLDNRRVLLFVSRLYTENRLDLLLEALPTIRQADPGALAVIIGDGPDRPRLERLARDVGGEDAVRFLGAVYDEDALTPWFLSADAFVYPRNIGLSLLHALGYGLPVITADAPEAQNPEIVAFRPGENGLAYEDDNVSALAEAVVRLLQDDSLRQRLSAGAERTALCDFSMDAMVEGYAAALRCAADIAAQRQRGHRSA